MEKVSALILALVLSGCGEEWTEPQYNNFSLAIGKFATLCVEGVLYISQGHGLSVMFNKDSTVMLCGDK